MEYSNLFVCLMGPCTVFIGLICIILLTYLMSFLCRQGTQKKDTLPENASPALAPSAESNQRELIAAVSAALAEDLGTDITGIRILSMKKL